MSRQEVKISPKVNVQGCVSTLPNRSKLANIAKDGQSGDEPGKVFADITLNNATSPLTELNSNLLVCKTIVPAPEKQPLGGAGLEKIEAKQPVSPDRHNGHDIYNGEDMQQNQLKLGCNKRKQQESNYLDGENDSQP